MASGIRDKVAILGMGCARFGERWDTDADGLMVEAFEEARADAGIEVSDIDAAWLGVGFDTQSVGPSGIPLATSAVVICVPRYVPSEFGSMKTFGVEICAAVMKLIRC